MTDSAAANGGGEPAATSGRRPKLHGRAFYESIGSPKYILAPMVDQSEFAWRMLSRSFMSPSERPSLLAYTPMLHARLFAENDKYRRTHFQPTRPKPNPTSSSNERGDAPDTAPKEEEEPFLDGNPSIDRPLIVQFCANDPDALLEAARRVAPHCDAVDLNLGCPQGIARKGHYGAFLQEDQDLIFRLVNTLHRELPVPVTAKIRVLDTPEATLAYARNVLAAGASILAVHGRRREQKGHLTGLADWDAIRHLRESLPPETVLFANGNVLTRADLRRCLEATGADGVMSAEGNLSDPAVFAAAPPRGQEGREYWRGRDGRGGWRVDAVMRRYLDLLHRYVLDRDPPARRELFMPGDDEAWMAEIEDAAAPVEAGEPARKKRKRDRDGGNGDGGGGGARREPVTSPNFAAMQPHMFHLLRHFVARHTDVRDLLGRSRAGDLEGYERVLTLVELRVARALIEYERAGTWDGQEDLKGTKVQENGTVENGTGEIPEKEIVETPTEAAGKDSQSRDAADKVVDEVDAFPDETPNVLDPDSSAAAVHNCRRPWWVAQPIIRPMPKEAVAKGALTLSKKEKKGTGAGNEAERARESSQLEEAADAAAEVKVEEKVAG